MEFTYNACRGLLHLLRAQGYAFTDYHQYAEHPRCVILRHDMTTASRRRCASRSWRRRRA